MEISTPKQAQQYDSLPFWQFIVARENGHVFYQVSQQCYDNNGANKPVSTQSF